MRVSVEPGFAYYQIAVLAGTSCARAVAVFEVLANQVERHQILDRQNCYAGYCTQDHPTATHVAGYRCAAGDIGDADVTWKIVCRRGRNVIVANAIEAA